MCSEASGSDLCHAASVTPTGHKRRLNPKGFQSLGVAQAAAIALGWGRACLLVREARPHHSDKNLMATDASQWYRMDEWHSQGVVPVATGTQLGTALLQQSPCQAVTFIKNPVHMVTIHALS